MADAQIARPGVEVVQVFEAASPTVIVPTLPACIVGVARQVVDVTKQSDSGSTELNPDALVSMVAEAVTTSNSPYPFGGRTMVLSINNGSDVSITFSGSGGSNMTAAKIAEEINAALADLEIGDAVAASFDYGTSNTRLRIRTTNTGDYASLMFKTGTHSSITTAFGVPIDYEYTGFSNYSQYKRTVPQSDFPDPRGNLDQLVMEADKIRVFLYLGSGATLTELKRNEALLMRGTYANVVGTVDMTTVGLYGGGGTLDTKVITLSVNGSASVSITFSAPANSAAVLAAFNSQQVLADAGLVASLEATTNYLVLSATKAFGADATINITAGNAVTVLGLTVANNTGDNAVVASDDNSGDNLTPYLQFLGHDFTAAAGSAIVRGTVDMTGLTFGDVDGTTLTLSVNGAPPQTLTFPVVANAAAINTAINNFFTGVTASLDGNNYLLLTSSDSGIESQIEVLSGTAVTMFGLTAGTVAYGDPYLPASGDEVYVGGSLVGTVTQVAPGGNVNILRINKQVALTYTGKNFYIKAKNLVSPFTSRPTPNLQLDGANNPILKHDVVQDVYGNIVSTPVKAPVYVSYRAVRQDVSPLANNPGLLAVDSTTQLGSLLDPITTENPLALGLYMALVNAPGVTVYGVGVDAISADSPYGTVEAYSRAAELLETEDVYALCPLTHEEDVGLLFLSHVVSLSEPENKSERIVLFNPERPTHRLDTLVASSETGNSTGTADEFDTGVLNLAALLQALDIDPTGVIPVSDGLYLDVGSDAKKYSVSAISGSVVTLRTSFLAGENDDSYYTTDAIPVTLINEAFSLKVRGAELVDVNDLPDKAAMASTYQEMAQGYKNRRFWHTMPDKGSAVLSGLEQEVEGFYTNACTAGLISALAPSQSFTNYPISGVTKVSGSRKYFSEKQLNIIAAGGNWIYTQDSDTGPVFSRMALTSDMTSIETRTDSITKVVDYTAKFIRLGLKNFIGRYNITEALVDSMSQVLQGLVTFLIDNAILLGASVEQIIQDEDVPDTVLVTVRLDVPYPCNYIRVTLLILQNPRKLPNIRGNMATSPGGTVSTWAPYYRYVQGGMVDGNYVNGAFTLIAAGPPRVANIGGSAALGSRISNSNPSADQLVYPLGIIQNIGLSQNKNFARIFEIGSERSYFIGGRTVGQLQMGRVHYHGPSFLRVLYAYYADSLSPTTFEALFNTDGGKAMSNPHNVYIPPGYENIFLNLASDLFGQPIGLLIYIRDISLQTLGAIYAEACVVPQHNWGTDSQGVLIQEQVGIQYERLVPVKMSAVSLIKGGNAGGASVSGTVFPGLIELAYGRNNTYPS